MRNSILEDTNLSGAELTKTDLTNAKLVGADLTGAHGDCALNQATLTSAILSRAILDHSSLEDAQLKRARVEEASLRKVNMKGARLQDAILCSTNFSGAIITDAKFTSADLSGANLTDVIVNTGTSFTNAKVDSCTIARHTLECLTDYGGLTPGQRMVMNIVDDVARLRASYSGFQQWVHLIALTLFVFPYAWFLIKNWTHAKFSSADGESTITLFFALIRFIWNGGQNLRDGLSLNLFAVTLFGIALTYNTVRAALLWKTKRLELTQEASGLPAIFSLRGTWGVLFQIARWGFYVNLFVVLLHTIYFLGQRIPTSVLP